MSITASTSSNATSDRLSKAIAAARPKVAADVPEPAPAPAPRPQAATDQTAPAPRTGPARDAARGAKAAPDAAATGAGAAATGASQVMGAGQPGSVAAAAPDPLPAPGPMPDAADTGVDPSLDPTATPTTSTAPVAGTGSWSADWQRRFEKLQLAPADIEYLAQSGYTDDQLFDIAMELDQVELLDPTGQQVDPYAASPTPGVDAGSVASADGPLPQGPMAQANVPTTGAWTPEWEQRFTDVMGRMGMSSTEIRSQLDGVAGQPLSEAQLAEAYRQMESSIGAFTPEWREKFSKVMEDLDTPKAEQEQVLTQLAGSGLDESQLTEAYVQMQNSLPAWNAEYEGRFKELGIPEEMLAQLKDSGAPKSALDQQLKQLVDTRETFRKDGRLEKLEDADATAEEQWGVMMQGTEGKEFDKVVEQIHSAHVPFWKRAVSFGVNLIPGVYALQYITGKDWVTQEKIDRSNPLNIVGAVASGFAGFTAVRSAVQGIQGLSAASRAATATMQAANAGKSAAIGLGASVEALGSASALSRGSFQAIEAAGLVSKFEKGLRFTDYLKSAVPLVNRFGEAGRLSAVGRGYFQGMQLAAGAASLKALEGGKVGVDAATRSTVLSELRQGRSIQDAMTAAGRSSGTGGGYAIRAQDIARDYSRYGFLQGGAGKLAEGNKLMRGSGNFRFSPFKNHATIGTTANPNVYSLGRNVNFGSSGGLAQGLGLVRGANSVANPGLYAQAAQRATGANSLMNARNAQHMVGLNMADDVQRIETMTKTAEWANKLGVTGGSRFRSLLQLGGSNRTAARVAGIVEHGGSQGYRAGRLALDQAQRFGNFAATPLVAGAAFGMTGKQMQPMWDYWKDRDAIQATERRQAEVADQEAEELARLYAQQQAGGGAAPQAVAPAAGAVAPTTAAPEAGVYVDPATGMYVDPQTGLRADPASGQVYDAQGNVVGNVNQPAA